MSRHPQKSGTRGSLRWIQEFVNGRAPELQAAIQHASGDRIQGPIEWVSPLEEDGFAEYRDGSFLEKLGVELTKRPLDSFWPPKGPQWDALGRNACGASILVEAKANIPELITSPTGAGSASKERIDAALKEVAEGLGTSASCDWSGTFYQYANRLAHLYLLSELNKLDCWLVFVYFIGDADVNGPQTEGEWKAALEVLHGALGLKRHAFLNRKVDVFLDVNA